MARHSRPQSRREAGERNGSHSGGSAHGEYVATKDRAWGLRFDPSNRALYGRQASRHRVKTAFGAARCSAPLRVSLFLPGELNRPPLQLLALEVLYRKRETRIGSVY